MYDYDAMILKGPTPNYTHKRQGPDSYVQVWLPPLLERQTRHHFSIAPEYNQNGFHITSANEKTRVYYDRTAKPLRRPKKPQNGVRISSVTRPDGWNTDAALMAAYLDTFRRS